MIGWLELILTRRVGKGASDSGIIKSVEQKGTLVIIGNTPGYLADACQLVADARVRKLRSANTRTLVVSRMRRSFGDRTFAAAGPQVWNSLPNLRLCGLSYGQFRRLLKTFQFGQ